MVFVYEDSWENYEPLSFLRPVFEIRAGVRTFREKLETFFNDKIHTVVRDELVDLCLEQWPQAARNLNTVPKGRHLFVAAGTILAGSFSPTDSDERFLDERGSILGFSTDRLSGYQSAGRVAEFLESEKLTERRIPGRRIKYPWEIFAGLELEVTRDFQGKILQGSLDNRATVYGEALRLEERSVVEAGAVIDCRKGPVTIASGALVKGAALIEGPCYIGPLTVVDSARLRAGTVLGPQCRVGGEVEASIFHGYVNKHHEGFIGHAYLGEWVNLGAMTTNSDLKNNYSEIRIVLNGEEHATGLTKFGCVMGDHTKTSIGTLIPTGAVVGIFANILGGGLCSKNVSSFTWGEGEVYGLSQLVQTVERVMARREVKTGQAFLERITKLHLEATGDGE